ncbi:Vacuolar protein sorting-associated protein 28 2, partial [Tetrabaena socialis]
MSFLSSSSSNLLPGGGNQDVRLYHGKKEQAQYESYADLYAIIKTTEKLERAFVRDAIGAEQYEEACSKLIGQFKVLWASMKDTVPNVERFMSDHNMQCPMAATRLLHSGMPATVEHRTKQGRANDPEALGVAECVQHFITAMDSLKLNLAAVDQ